METPFGVAFLKKAELYNLINRLDKQTRETKEESSDPSLWPIEKQILKWTYTYHRHLGSPIGTEHLSLGDRTYNKLKDMGMLDMDGKLKPEFSYLSTGALQKPLENLVVRGFAEYFDKIQHGTNKIIINKEGLLLGEVLVEMESRNPFIQLNFLLYSKLMNHLGASIVLIATFWTLWKLFNISELFK